MRLSAAQVKSCRGTLAESLGRGLGAIEFKYQPGGVQAYFRYYRDSKPVRIKIGAFGERGYSLVEIRTKAGELAKLRQEIAPVDLKLHLDRGTTITGSLADLLDSYIDDMKVRKCITIDQTQSYIDRDIKQAFPRLAETPAREIVPQDIVKMCSVVHKRGGIASANRLRSCLSAAFNYGLKAEHDHTRPSDAPRFGLIGNPVSATRKNQNATKPGKRVLTKTEIKHLWNNLGACHAVGPIVSAMIKFCLATGGQRPLQVLRAAWSDYNFHENTFTMIDTKGRAETEKIHVVPLSPRALMILEDIPRVYEWPFAAWEKKPLKLTSLMQGLNRYFNKFPEVERFTVRDIRRTAKNLLIDAGVNRDDRNLLQSHGLHGVDYKHYDRHHHLPEKRAAMEKYDAILASILEA